MDQNSHLRTAIAGCHRMLARTPGSHNWAAAFAAVPETQVVAVFDRGAETRAAFRRCWADVWGDIREFDSFELMLADVQPDLVCIATRQTMHAGQVEQAVAAGVRGVLCDKPLATSLAEMDRILSACRGGAVPLAFGLDRRWWAVYGEAARLLAEGVIGRVTSVHGYGLQTPINHGCHWFDVMLRLAGDPEVAWVSGHLELEDATPAPPTSPRRLDPPGTALAWLANGVQLHVTPDGRPGPAFEVLGDRGRLLLLNDARDALLWTVEQDGGRTRLQPAAIHLPPVEDGWPAGPAIVRDLVRAVRDGGQTACDVDEARRATEIGFAIHASHHAGGARLAIDQVDRTLRVESLPWGNE